MAAAEIIIQSLACDVWQATRRITPSPPATTLALHGRGEASGKDEWRLTLYSLQEYFNLIITFKRYNL